ncbi:response regulator transcription factor [Bradyrhizobium jicamae]|uniref:LuxR C-terminal-related transcriptional regulator n=1 Tax=Bradyrhizobium jicamae TaxID=280332 RepID=UPI001BABF54F|nr:response regulator transcription factor [Bradyrhizobium jicamae]MBR0932157.1 response regulator transcription factor [Bradyrhizobium jicamae]
MRRRYSFASVIVGKNGLRKEGLVGILRSANFHILASVSSADDLIACKIQPGPLLFLVVQSADELDNGVDRIALLKQRHPAARIVIVADHYRPDEVVASFRAGVNGFFVDGMGCDAFIKSLELVMMGETVFPPAFLTYVFDAESGHAREVGMRQDNEATLAPTQEATAPQLSPREQSILRCLIEGDSNKCIARKIDIAEATVKVHVKAILRKIRVQNRTQAAIWGMNHRSMAAPANGRLAYLNREETDERRPVSAAESGEIKQIQPQLRLGVISYETNAHAARDHRLGRSGVETGGLIRLRK